MVLCNLRFRLYPTNTQRELLAKHFGCYRFVYNHFLSKRVEAYLANQQRPSYYNDSKDLTELKRSTPWLEAVNAQSLQFALKCLDGAYGRFLGKMCGFPRFKSKRGQQSFRCPQRVAVVGKRLYIPRFRDGIKLVLHRPVLGRIKHVTIIRDASGRFFASLCVECDVERLPPKSKVVGVDLGIKALATQSDGVAYENIRPAIRFQPQMTKLRRWLARTTFGTKLHDRVRMRIAKLQRRIADIRRDHLHKVSKAIVQNAGTVVLEDLNIAAMLRDGRFACSVRDAGLASLVEMIEYKAAWYGRSLIKIDRWFPSSKTCSDCAYINENLTIRDRAWKCPSCGTMHDRDLNAAINIRQQGIALQTVGATGIAWGAGQTRDEARNSDGRDCPLYS